MANCVYSFLFGFVCACLFFLIVFLVRWVVRVKNKKKGFCIDCECYYISYDKESFNYCPCCGNKFGFHYDFEDDGGYK